MGFGNIWRLSAQRCLADVLRVVASYAGYGRTVGECRLRSRICPSQTRSPGRLATRTYASRSWVTTFGQDAGQKARYIHKVFDESTAEDGDDWECTKGVVYMTPGPDARRHEGTAVPGPNRLARPLPHAAARHRVRTSKHQLGRTSTDDQRSAIPTLTSREPVGPASGAALKPLTSRS